MRNCRTVGSTGRQILLVQIFLHASPTIDSEALVAVSPELLLRISLGIGSFDVCLFAPPRFELQRVRIFFFRRRLGSVTMELRRHFLRLWCGCVGSTRCQFLEVESLRCSTKFFLSNLLGFGCNVQDLHSTALVIKNRLTFLVAMPALLAHCIERVRDSLGRHPTHNHSAPSFRSPYLDLHVDLDVAGRDTVNVSNRPELVRYRWRSLNHRTIWEVFVPIC